MPTETRRSGMHVEKAEDLGLGKSERVPNRAGLERGVFRQLDHELHAEGPLAARVAGRQTETLVEPLADRADGAVAHDGELRANIHAGHEAIGRCAELVHTLIGETESGDTAALRVRRIGKERSADGCARPDLHKAASHQLRAHPLIELADGKDQAAAFVEKRRRPGQIEGRVSDPPLFPESEKNISKTQKRGAPAGANGIEQIENALLLDRSGHGNLRGIERGETRANAFGACDHATDARGQIVGTLVTQHLQRHARSDAAFKRRIGGIPVPGFSERGKKSTRGRTEAGAGNVDFHRLPVDLDGLWSKAHAG